jgi:hypothetical protein
MMTLHGVTGAWPAVGYGEKEKRLETPRSYAELKQA